MYLTEESSISESRRRQYWNGFYPVKRLQSRPQCSVAEVLNNVIQARAMAEYEAIGRDMDTCELHIDGNLIFQAFGVLGAGLALLTYQAIKDKGRKRRRRSAGSLSFPEQLEMMLLGRI